MQRAAAACVRLLESRRFFYGVVIFFVAESLWIAASAAYPMAFDEDFHFGLITFYAGHLLPFMSTQPEWADAFGAVSRDPSYLYHYLMSFPYRFLQLYTDNQTAIVMILRFINIALAAWSVVLFRRVLLRAGLSAAGAHCALAVFVLIPIVPLLAAHINYDNALLVLVAWSCLLAGRIREALHRRLVPLRDAALLLCVCMGMALIKYETLPIVCGLLLFVAYAVFRAVRGNAPVGHRDWRQALRTAAAVLPRRTAFLLVGAGIVLAGLCVQRFGVNVVAYQALKPDCAALLGESRCMAYGPWARNHQLTQTADTVTPKPLAYAWLWFQSLHYRSFFMVSGPANWHRNFPPLPLPAAAAVVMAVTGVCAVILYARKIFAGHDMLGLYALVAGLYLIALFVETYTQYLETGRAVAINGRYLLLIMVPLAAILVRALSVALQPWLYLKALFAAGMIFLFMQGGGVWSFIVRSDAAWYWPNETIIRINDTARSVVNPVIIGN